MTLQFYKYQGTGNDFVIADNRNGSIQLNQEQVAFLCDRRFGIGADGLMLLELEDGYDFKMVYYNSDGNESTMCGNGGRCITAFAKLLGVVEQETTFIAIDGPHHATIDADNYVQLAMQDVKHIDFREGYTILNTGSPHYVTWVDDVNNTDIFKLGRAARNQDEFQPNGINVNFVQKIEDKISVRTYERGVEDETLSCGTGVTACAIATVQQNTGSFSTDIQTPGGQLNVSFSKPDANSAKNIILSGPATLVYSGTIEV